MEKPALSRAQVISVVEGRSIAPRVPMLINYWVTYPERFGDRQPQLFQTLGRYPMDAQIMCLAMPEIYEAPPDDPSYRWFQMDDPYKDGSVAYDERIVMPDWDHLDDVIAGFPAPSYRGLCKHNEPADGRYRLAILWTGLFERLWFWRGMVNALTDYYLYPEQVHRLYRAWTDFYLKVFERARLEMHVDGIMISDDLGTQTGPFFSPEIFDRFFAPYYRELIDGAHRLGLHIWFHACGCIDEHLPRLVDLGLDVIHPIQKYAMSYEKTARDLGGRLCFWAGIDVQQVIPWGTPQDVRAEVRYLIDTFWRPEGRLLLGASNVIGGDCSIPNLEALLDEAYEYGTRVVSRTGRG